MTTLHTLRLAMHEYREALAAVHSARDRAYDAIRAASAEGLSLRAIGDATDLSHQRVAQVVAGDNA